MWSFYCGPGNRQGDPNNKKKEKEADIKQRCVARQKDEGAYRPHHGAVHAGEGSVQLRAPRPLPDLCGDPEALVQQVQLRLEGHLRKRCSGGRDASSRVRQSETGMQKKEMSDTQNEKQ